MSRLPLFSISILAVSISLLGAGCLKSQQTPSRQTDGATSTITGKPNYPTFPVKDVVKTPKDELAQIFENFKNTKSFRAKAHTQTVNTEMDVQMEFSKPNRFRGQLLPKGGASSTELIIVDRSLYLKVDGGIWVDFTKSQGSNTLGEAMLNTFNNTDLQKLVTAPSASVDKANDAGRDCTLYSVRLTLQDTERNVKICTSNDLPKYVDTTLNGATNSIEYYDYNVILSIAKPI